MYRNKFCPPPLKINHIKRPRHVIEQARRTALCLPGLIDRWLAVNSRSDPTDTFQMLSLCGGVTDLVQCTVKRACIAVSMIPYK